jgi:hypothetical protein
MSKQQVEKTIRAELEVLNEVIDQKIIRGLSYRKEGYRHKFLISQLGHMRKEHFFKKNWFERSVRLASAFLL